MIFACDNLPYTMPEKGKEASLYNKAFGSKQPAIITGYILSLMDDLWSHSGHDKDYDVEI